MAPTSTAAERLEALAELREAVEAKLADALALAKEGGGEGAGHGARLSRQDAAAFRRQLALLGDLEAWLLAGRAEAAGRAAEADGGRGHADDRKARRDA